MDPHERLFLQVVWATLEDAGYTRGNLTTEQDSSSVGVFVGATFNNYQLYFGEKWAKGELCLINSQICSIANRVSYFFDFHGPSFTIDAACASSLSAVHMAWESLLRGQCQVAIAGGVNLSLHPSKYYSLGEIGFLSELGRCHSFGKKADGMVSGEGVGAVLLKPISQALKDRDHIYGVIKAGSSNHCGKTSGYTVPNPKAQASVILQTLKAANIDPSTINYVEAHGTGTPLGDPIEIAGLSEAFSQYTSDKQFCAIGSIKSNLGHLEAAAGISQLTKVLLQMQHQKLVPSLHAEELNPNIDFASTPFYVQRALEAWACVEIAENGSKHVVPRRASISSFGATGTNVHLIVEEFVPDLLSPLPSTPAKSRKSVFVLSAKTLPQLQNSIAAFTKFMQNDASDIRLEDLIFTLQTGREAMKWRLAIIIDSKEDLSRKLQLVSDKFDIVRQEGEDNIFLTEVTPQSKPEFTETSSKRNLEEVADLWSKGANIDWPSLYNDDLNLRRVSLPTYPFAKKRYWPDQDNKTQTAKKEKDPLLQTRTENFSKVAKVYHQLLTQLSQSPQNEHRDIIAKYVQEKLVKVLGLDP